MRNWPTLLLCLMALAACGGREEGLPSASAQQPSASPQPPSAAQQPSTSSTQRVEAETNRLNAWFEARFEEQLDFSPMQKTMLGRRDDYDKIDDESESAQDAQMEWLRGTAEELRREFDYDLLTPEARISYDVWLYQLERAEAAVPYRRHGYIFTQMSGPQASLPQFLINFHEVEDAGDMEAYIARIGGISRALGQLLERAQFAAAEGIRPPRFAYEEVLAQARALVTGSPFDDEGDDADDEGDEADDPGSERDSPLWADAKAKIDGLLESGEIDAVRADSLRGAARSALEAQFKPAYDALIAWVEEDLPQADDIATGVWKLPDGRDFYSERLLSATTTEMNADEIHELGLSEVARIRTQMEAIRESVGFEGNLEEFFVFVREDPRFYFPNTDEGREAYLDAARTHLGAIEARLPEFFGLLPKAGLVVRRVEAFREQPGAAQHYFPGTPDGSRAGIYYTHLADMRELPIPQLEVIAYHEGIPGHHMQISIAQELTSVPEFRTQSFFNAYVEGWALYAELLAKEMGAYEDPYSDFGRLTTEIWRAIRLVVDTGLHSKEWTEEQAVEYFRANSPAAEGQIRSEVRRYIVLPGQATSYKVGMLEILELRRKAEAELEDDFDIRGFHDTVLGGGALPLSILARRVEDWIRSF